MTDPPKYNVEFSGTFTNSGFAVGDHAVLNMTPGAAAARLDPAELEALRTAIAELETQVREQAPQGRRDEALGEVQAIAEATVGADEVDVPRLKRVVRWFATNAPDLAGAVTGLLFGPAVGAIVGTAGGLATALLAPDEDVDAT
jgi:hypothetical protein